MKKDNENSVKPHKTFSLKAQRRIIALLLALLIILSFVNITMFVGDASIISFIENYSVNDPPSINPQLEFVKGQDGESWDIINKSDSDLKVLQLSDLHIGAGLMTLGKDRALVKEVITCVCSIKPDMIILTGDCISPIYVRSLTKNSYNELDALTLLMKKIGLPWAFVFGNHDEEGLASKEYISNRLENEERCLFLSGKSSLNGSGNYYIKLYNSDQTVLESAMFFMDSGTKKWFHYNGITEDQIEWYSSKVAQLKLQRPDIITSLFMHIPIPEYKTFWNEYANGNQRFILHFGKRQENISVTSQHGFYDAIVDQASTKWLFVGHNHYNSFSLEDSLYGIRLTFGLSMDFSAYITSAYRTDHRGGLLITMNVNGISKIQQCPQDNGYLPL